MARKADSSGLALLGGDAFGVELDAVNRRLGMPHGHHRSVLAPGVGDQRRARVGHRQRMIAGRGERRGQAGEQAAAVMADLATLPWTG